MAHAKRKVGQKDQLIVEALALSISRGAGEIEGRLGDRLLNTLRGRERIVIVDAEQFVVGDLRKGHEPVTLSLNIRSRRRTVTELRVEAFSEKSAVQQDGV